jgi:hypothetical protein
MNSGTWTFQHRSHEFRNAGWSEKLSQQGFVGLVYCAARIQSKKINMAEKVRAAFVTSGSVICNTVCHVSIYLILLLYGTSVE